MDQVIVQQATYSIDAMQRRFEDCAIDVSRALSAPHLIYGAKLSKDGNQWCWLYGDNLQEGIAGFGDTPEQAARAFDTAWSNERAK
jgi:hypothetical protein